MNEEERALRREWEAWLAEPEDYRGPPPVGDMPLYPEEMGVWGPGRRWTGHQANAAVLLAGGVVAVLGGVWMLAIGMSLGVWILLLGAMAVLGGVIMWGGESLR